MKTYINLTREERVQKVMRQRKVDLALVLENLSENLNISAILRTAEGFGVGLVCIIHSRSVKPKLSMQASSGAIKWLDIKYYTSTTTCLKLLKKSGFKIIASVVDPKASLLWEQSFRGKIAVMVGNEAKGLSEKAINLSDKKVYLPMFGLTESLNVSVAAALFLYEVIRQKEVSRVE